MSTIRDVAQASGFSVSTVSIVLRGQAAARKIPPQTQEKILAAARGLSYQPNLSARKLRDSGGEQYTIGLFWAADSRTIVLARVLKGIQQALVESSHSINLVICPYTSGRLCDDKSLQGISAYNAAIIATADEEDLAWLEANPPMIPIVIYNRTSPQFSSVSADNMEAGRLAALQFIQKGERDIGAVLQKTPFLAMHKRRSSFFQACEDHGVTIEQRNIVWTDGTIGGGFDAGLQIASWGRIPRAIYCDEDAAALGLLSAFAQKGLQIPRDARVVAIGTGPPALNQFSVPPLTVVELPLEDMAIQSMNLLVDILLHKRSAPQHVVFSPRLIVRESCQ